MAFRDLPAASASRSTRPNCSSSLNERKTDGAGSRIFFYPACGIARANVPTNGELEHACCNIPSVRAATPFPPVTSALPRPSLRTFLEDLPSATSNWNFSISAVVSPATVRFARSGFTCRSIRLRSIARVLAFLLEHPSLNHSSANSLTVISARALWRSADGSCPRPLRQACPLP